MTIHGKGTGGPYSLDYHNIVQNSVTVFEESIELDADSYKVEYIAGFIRFARPLAVGDSVSVKFRYIPLILSGQYFLHNPSRAPESSSRPPAGAIEKTTYQPSDISIRGSKGFSIEAGEGAGGLSQFLNLTINGNIVSGLRTSAHISDKSGNAGAARRIEEIDRIYIDAESDYFKGTFGDFEYVRENDMFLTFRRKLTGLDANYGKGEFSVSGAAAFFPGEYSSISIAGVDGRLGPYYLSDIGGRQGAVILSGSERVYIDGVLQKRGSENDYTVDYDAGAIEFSPSKVITNESRITIDYEIAREEYSRSFYAAAGRGEAIPNLSVFGSLIQEGDRSGAPKSFEMTPENRAVLEQAGDSRLAASRDGAEYVGPGAGDYISQTDTAGTQYYVYAGPGLGDYRVAFSFISVGGGSYSSRGAGVYQYMGAGQGDYEPIILIPLPEIRRYGSAGVSYAAPDSGFFMETEFAGTQRDRNTISRLDNPSEGISGSLVAGLLHRFSADGGFAGARTRIRKIASGAVFPGRIDAVERYREYDISPDSGSGGEDLQEATIEGGMDDTRRVGIDIGFLKRPGIKDRSRQAGDMSWRLPGSLDWFGHLERTHGDRTWLKRSTGVSADFAKAKPALRIDFEKRDGESGFKFYEYKASIPAQYSSGISGSTDLGFRDEKSLETTWIDKFKSGSILQSVKFAPAGSPFTGEFAGSYFKKKYAASAGTDSDQKTGRLNLTYSDPENRGELYLGERLSSSNQRLQTKSYIFVGEGKGDFRFEDGEYIRDADGDYIQLIEELGEGVKISEIATEINGSVSPFLILSGGSRLLKNVGRLVIESELTYSLRKSSNVLVGRDFFPWDLKGRNDVAFDNGRIDLRVYFYPAGTKHRWKYAGARSFQNGNPYVNEAVSQKFNSDELSWAFPAGPKIDLLVTGRIASEKSELNGTGYTIGRHSESARSDFKLTELLTLETTAGFEGVRQTDIDVRSSIPSGELELIRDIGKKGRASAGISYYRVIVDPAGTYIPFQVAGGKREGDNFTANARARLELYKNGRLEFSYRYEKFADRPQRNNMRLEFTILFQ